METWKIVLLNGKEEIVSGYIIRSRDGVLAIRTTHQTAYFEDWIYWPLTSVESWRKV